MVADDDGRLAEGEDEVGGRHLAEAMIDRAHRQPVLIDPGLDPVMGVLVAAVGQRHAGHQPGRDAAVAEQGDEQPGLGGAVAGPGLQAVGRRLGGPPRLGSLAIS